MVVALRQLGEQCVERGVPVGAKEVELEAEALLRGVGIPANKGKSQDEEPPRPLQ